MQIQTCLRNILLNSVSPYRLILSTLHVNGSDVTKHSCALERLCRALLAAGIMHLPSIVSNFPETKNVRQHFHPLPDDFPTCQNRVQGAERYGYFSFEECYNATLSSMWKTPCLERRCGVLGRSNPRRLHALGRCAADLAPAPAAAFVGGTASAQPHCRFGRLKASGWRPRRDSNPRPPD